MAAKRSSTPGARHPKNRSNMRRAGKRATKTRKPTSDQLLAVAVRLARRGNAMDALGQAKAIVDADPGHWRALGFIANILWRMEQPESALQALAATIDHAPDEAKVQIDLAAKFISAALKTKKDLERAVAIGERTLNRHGPTWPLLNALVNVQAQAGHLAESLKTVHLGTTLFPDKIEFQRHKSVLLTRMGRLEESLEAFAHTIRPNLKNSRSISDVRSRYTALAPGYDNNTLHQSFSERMAKFVFGLVGSTLNKRILDAGCGTGLLATRMKAACLVGIDKSPDMLAQARARGIYAELIEGDLVQAMSQRTDSFDLVISACVLYHIANLAPFFREAARILIPGGYLFLSVDPAPDTMEMGATAPGEYAHSRRYLRRVAAETGFTEAAIKIMEHRATPGFWCAFRRT